MATKEEVIGYIKTLAEQKILTRDEVATAYDSGSKIKVDTILARKLGITEILYYL